MENQNVIVTPSSHQPPAKHGMPVILQVFLGVILAVALVVFGAAGAYFLMQANQGNNADDNAKVVLPVKQDNANNGTGEVPPVTSTDDLKQPDTVAPADQETLISWTEPKLAGDLGLFLRSKFTADDGLSAINYYYVGNVSGGKYSGGRVVLALLTFETMGSYNAPVRFIEKDGEYSYIKNSSDDYARALKSIVSVDSDWSIPGLIMPKNIIGPGARQLLEKVDYTNPQIFKSNNIKLAFTDKTYGKVYTTADYPTSFSDIYDRFGYYVKSPDGLVVTYQIKPDFFDAQLVPNITWSDGSKNSTSYNYTDTTGCGSANYASVMSPSVVKDNDLVEVGKNSSGDPIYAFKNNNYAMIQTLYNENKEYLKSADISYSQYLAIRPIVFWRDGFGRLIRMKNTKVMPMAECGKPVIYLYPEKTTDVSVKLEPQGGFSYTEPVYNNGWNVTAEPNGKLTNGADGKTYPYLFWEGRGGIYESPKKGFVVAKNDVHDFLVEKLAQAGLNAQETADFIEFWEPKMQAAPYYFVGFSGNVIMDRLAPLDISPKPDTVIRILMDFQPLAKPIKVQGYEIKTPERQGFTVVEWGGVLR